MSLLRTIVYFYLNLFFLIKYKCSKDIYLYLLKSHKLVWLKSFLVYESLQTNILWQYFEAKSWKASSTWIDDRREVSDGRRAAREFMK